MMLSQFFLPRISNGFFNIWEMVFRGVVIVNQLLKRSSSFVCLFIASHIDMNGHPAQFDSFVLSDHLQDPHQCY